MISDEGVSRPSSDDSSEMESPEAVATSTTVATRVAIMRSVPGGAYAPGKPHDARTGPECRATIVDEGPGPGGSVDWAVRRKKSFWRHGTTAGGPAACSRRTSRSVGSRLFCARVGGAGFAVIVIVMVAIMIWVHPFGTDKAAQTATPRVPVTGLQPFTIRQNQHHTGSNGREASDDANGMLGTGFDMVTGAPVPHGTILSGIIRNFDGEALYNGSTCALLTSHEDFVSLFAARRGLEHRRSGYLASSPQAQRFRYACDNQKGSVFGLVERVHTVGRAALPPLSQLSLPSNIVSQALDLTTILDDDHQQRRFEFVQRIGTHVVVETKWGGVLQATLELNTSRIGALRPTDIASVLQTRFSLTTKSPIIVPDSLEALGAYNTVASATLRESMRTTGGDSMSLMRGWLQWRTSVEQDPVHLPEYAQLQPWDTVFEDLLPQRAAAVRLAIHEYESACTASGDSSTLEPQDTPCSGHGTCRALPGSHRCLCDEGYYGNNCETRGCAIGHNDMPCSGRGACEDSHCRCSAGWGGRACDCPLGGNSLVCSGHGTCEHSACTCVRGYQGNSCQDPCGQSVTHQNPSITHGGTRFAINRCPSTHAISHCEVIAASKWCQTHYENPRARATGWILTNVNASTPVVDTVFSLGVLGETGHVCNSLGNMYPCVPFESVSCAVPCSSSL